MYPALTIMIEDGLIGVTERSSPLGPPRRYLSLTASGKNRLKEMSDHWLSVRASVETLMQVRTKGDRDE